jgi:hypothetical protein
VGRKPILAQDERLIVRELVERPTRPLGLVVLSACESAAFGGSELNNVLGLVTGFTAVGAENILGILWRVPDEASLPLALRFYESRVDGRDIASPCARRKCGPAHRRKDGRRTDRGAVRMASESP